MSVLVLIVALAVLALFGWALTQFPMDATIANLIRVVIIVIAVLLVLSFLLQIFGVNFPFLSRVKLT